MSEAISLISTIEAFWHAVALQDETALTAFFMPEASVSWPNTKEHFSVSEYVEANCQYPDDWNASIEKIIDAEDFIISVTKVETKDEALQFYAVSFFEFHEGKILSLQEYWGDISEPPLWRLALKLGK